MVLTLPIARDDLQVLLLHPLQVSQQTPLVEVLEWMGQCSADDAVPSQTRAQIRDCVCVVEQERLCGLVTQGDVIRALAAGRSPTQTPVAAVMQQPEIILQLSDLTDLAILLNQLQTSALAHWPVVEGDRLVGILTAKGVQTLLGKALRQVSSPLLEDQETVVNALRRAEATNRAIIQAIPDLLMRANKAGQHLEILGRGEINHIFWADSDVQNVTLESLPPPLMQKRLQAIQIALQTQSLQIYEHKLEILGEIHWEEVRIAPLNVPGDASTWEAGAEDQAEAAEVLVMVRDITDRKRRELAYRQTKSRLQDSEALQRAIIEAIPDCLIRVNRHGEYLDFLSGNGSVKPLRPDDALAHPTVYDVLPPAAAQNKMAAIQRAFATGAIQQYEQQLMLDGQPCWEEVWVNRLNAEEALVIVRNITDRKQAEAALRQLNQDLESRIAERTQALRASEERWQLAVQSYNAGIWDWDIPKDQTFRSPRWKDIRGLSQEEVGTDTKAWSDRIHPGDRPRVLATLQAYLTHAAPAYREEYRVRHKDGSYIWILDQGQALWNEQGEAIRMVGSEIDITQRKQAEAALRESEDRFRRVFEQNPVGIAITDLKGRLTRANASLAATLGYTNAELLHRSIQELLQIDPQQSDILLNQVLEQTLSVTSFEVQSAAKDGEVRWLTVTSSLILNAHAQPASFVHLVEDITERKQVEDQLRKSEAHLSTAQRIAKLGSWEYCLQTQILQWSDETYQIFGLDPQNRALTYADFQRYVHPEDLAKIESSNAIMLSTGQSQDVEYRICRPDGTMRYVLSRAEVMGEKEDYPSRLVGTVLDISDRRQAELQLEQINERLTLTNAELDRATRLKDEFLANMSHELRTPLNTILGMAEGLQEAVFGEVGDRQRHPIEMIERSGKHLLELINDILDLSKIEAGKLELQVALASAKDLCESSLAFIRPQALKKGLRLTLEVPPALPLIPVDELRIRQVLINLLSNAVKFTLEGGEVTLSVASEWRNEQPYLRFSVQDTGIGISSADLNHLFQPFVQLDSSLNRQQPGTGLGLALVHRLVELHQGTLEVVSQPDHGSCFTLWLPATNEPSRAMTGESFTAPATSEHSARQAHLQPSETLPFSPPLILLAEDHEMNTITLSSYLTARGYRLIHAKDGHEAVSYARTHHPDLILMDIQMPGMDGLEAIRQIRADQTLANIPIVALTALAMAGDRERCLQAGASLYLRKPVKLKELTDVVQQILRPQ